jgi:protein TonB
MSHAGELTTPVNRLVVIAFKVRTDSTLYDLKVVSTPGESYSREALRLLRDGPKWTPAVREGQVVEEKVTVSIVFK